MVKILVIEDDLKIRQNIARLLAFEDYEVLTADNGVAGLQQAFEEVSSAHLARMVRLLL